MQFIESESKQIFDIDGQLCRAEVVVRTVGIDFRAAVSAGVTVESRICPAYTDLSLHVPVAVDDPVVAVGHTEAGKPSLIAHVFQFSEICAEHREAKVYLADVVLAPEEMGAEEMS